MISEKENHKKPQGEVHHQFAIIMHFLCTLGNFDVWPMPSCRAEIKEQQLKETGKYPSHIRGSYIRGFEQEEGIVHKSQVTCPGSELKELAAPSGKKKKHVPPLSQLP